MNIVIIGAGTIGLHLARVFSQVDYGIVLVDHDPLKLEQASRELDVATKIGTGTDWELLEDLLENSPDLLIAVTNNDEINLVACSIAKHLGYRQTIARVRKRSYFMPGRLNFERLFSVDHLIGPEKLTANGIANLILMPGAVATEHFAHGAIVMRTMIVPPFWQKGSIPLAQTEKLGLSSSLMVGLIKRTHPASLTTEEKEEIIFPHGDDVLLPNDEVTFLGQPEAIYGLHKFFGLSPKFPKSVMIVGGSLIGINLARILHDHDIRVTVLEKELQKCNRLAELLPFATIIHRNGTDYRFLESEKIGTFDIFVACTREDEVNFLAAAAAKDLGSPKVIISLTDTSYLPLAKKLHIDHIASARIFAANRISTIAREFTIASMLSLYENRAEVIEVKVSQESKIVGIPIHQLGPELPHDFLILVIQSRGRVFIAEGTKVISPGDTVLVICSPVHAKEIRKLF